MSDILKDNFMLKYIDNCYHYHCKSGKIGKMSLTFQGPARILSNMNITIQLLVKDSKNVLDNHRDKISTSYFTGKGSKM